MVDTGGAQRHPADTARLEKWWLTEAGIPWGTPGDFAICVNKAREVFAKHGVTGVDPEGWCSNLHVKATGARPGHAATEGGK